MFGIAAPGSFKRQVILTFVVGFFFLISTFVVYMIKTERSNLYHDSVDKTTGLAESLAVSSLSWVLANDVMGLQEVAHSFRAYPELRYAMVISPAGRVLAHSDAAKVGQFLSDEPSLALIKAPPGNRVMRDDGAMIDVAVPVSIHNRHVGWARIGLGREKISGELQRMMLESALFVLLSTALSLFAAIFIANRLGYRIGSLVRVAEDVQAGNFATRVRIPGGVDEITRLADSLNQMLDALSQNDQELRAASLYTRSLIEASLDPLVTISAEGKITDVNQATEAITGRSRTELIGTDFSDYFTEPDKAREGYRQVFDRGFVTDYPLALRHRDGHISDVLYNASVYRNEAGAVLGVFAAARDITERKRAEETRTQLAAIVESSDDAIIGKTMDNIITSWNHGAEQMYGYTAREAVGQSISLIVPEDKRQELQEFSDRINKGERVKHHETIRVARDGRRIEVSLSLSPVLDKHGAITGTSAIARDITERKRDEELIRRNNQLLETVFSSIHVMIAYLDKDFNFIKVNKAYAAADQRTPDFFPGKNHFDLYPDEENKAIFQKVVATGEPVVYNAKPFEFAEHPERGVTYWDWRLEPIAGAAGKVEGLLFSLLNVTEQTLAVQKIRAAAQYARSLIEASLDPLVTISAEGKITDVNTATEQVTGHSRDTLIGTDFSDYFTEPEKARQGYRQVFAQGFVTDYPLALRHRDGHVTDVLYNASVYRNESGTVLGAFAAARDITERKRAEEALRENEHFLDSVVEHIPNMLFVKDAVNLNFVRFNKAGEELLGYSRNELIGKNDRDFFPQEQADFFIAKDREIIARGELLDIPEEPINTRYSGQRYLHTKKIPVFADDGSPRYLLGISEDITERKRTEEELLERERHSQSLLRLSRNMERSQTYAEVLNAAREEVRNIIGYQNLWAYLLTEDKKYFKALAAGGPESDTVMSEDGTATLTIAGDHMLEEIAQAKEIVIVADAQIDGRVNKEIVARMGNRTIVNIPITLFERNLGSLGMGTFGDEGVRVPSSSEQNFLIALASHLAVALDRIHLLTERRKAEKELRDLNNDFVTLLESTGDFIYFKDRDSRFRFCSQTMANITGHHSWRDMIGKHDLEVFPKDTARLYYEEELPIFREGKALLNKTDPYYDEMGRPGWVNTNKWPVFGDDRKTVVGIFGISRDITELKEAEDKINELNRDLERRVAERTEQLEAANKELEAFSYSVSHDLRSPLRAIDGFSHILLEDYNDKLDEEGKRLLNVVRDNTSRMGQLIDDILKFSRAGRLEINFSEIDMESMAREVYEELRPAAGHELQAEIGHLPPAMGDHAMMRQVFVNLLSNAIKFTRARGDARIEVGSSAGENETVYFVKDNGAGFDMQYADKLFGVFQRLHSVNEFEGTGIGLAIVKRIITRHGGRVWAEGRINEGATMYFTLPAGEKQHE